MLDLKNNSALFTKYKKLPGGKAFNFFVDVCEIVETPAVVDVSTRSVVVIVSDEIIR